MEINTGVVQTVVKNTYAGEVMEQPQPENPYEFSVVFN